MAGATQHAPTVQQGGFIGAVNGDRNYYAAIGDTWVLSPSLVADFRVGLTRVAADNRAETFDDMDYTQFGFRPRGPALIGSRRSLSGNH